MKTIYLPSAEDTNVEIAVDGSKPVTIDAFELDMMIYNCAEEVREDGVGEWPDKFIPRIKRLHSLDLSTSQCHLLYASLQEVIRNLKKSVSERLNNSDDSDASGSKPTSTAISSRSRQKPSRRKKN